MNTDNRIHETVERAAISGQHKSLQVDVERYQAYLDDPEMTDAERRQVIEALWVIVSCFVELGFQVHPTQQACGKVENALDVAGNSDSTEAQSRHRESTDKPSAPEL